MTNKAMVWLTEMDDWQGQKEHKDRPVLVDVDHIAYVAPRTLRGKSYTTLIVSGRYVHVRHPIEEVLGRMKAAARAPRIDPQQNRPEEGKS